MKIHADLLKTKEQALKKIQVKQNSALKKIQELSAKLHFLDHKMSKEVKRVSKEKKKFEHAKAAHRLAKVHVHELQQRLATGMHNIKNPDDAKNPEIVKSLKGNTPAKLNNCNTPAKLKTMLKFCDKLSPVHKQLPPTILSIANNKYYHVPILKYSNFQIHTTEITRSEAHSAIHAIKHVKKLLKHEVFFVFLFFFERKRPATNERTN